jgi:hexosaminidase
MRRRLIALTRSSRCLAATAAHAQPTQAQLDRLRRRAARPLPGARQPPRPPPPARPPPSCHLAELTLAAPEPPAAGWSLYFSSVVRILRAGGDAFVLSHINGDLYRLTPTAPFAGFAPRTSGPSP